VGSKWVFQAKKNAAGNVICYKARLIAQGFSQVSGVDYFDMFAPVVHLASIHTILAFAAAEDYEMGKIDIKAAYLNGELTVRFIMVFTRGFHTLLLPNLFSQFWPKKYDKNKI
jgi:hypothetical protein